MGDNVDGINWDDASAAEDLGLLFWDDVAALSDEGIANTTINNDGGTLENIYDGSTNNNADHNNNIKFGSNNNIDNVMHQFMTEQYSQEIPSDDWMQQGQNDQPQSTQPNLNPTLQPQAIQQYILQLQAAMLQQQQQQQQGVAPTTNNNGINYWGVEGINFPSVEVANNAGYEGAENQPHQIMYQQPSFPHPLRINQSTAGSPVISTMYGAATQGQYNPIISALQRLQNQQGLFQQQQFQTQRAPQLSFQATQQHQTSQQYSIPQQAPPQAQTVPLRYNNDASFTQTPAAHSLQPITRFALPPPPTGASTTINTRTNDIMGRMESNKPKRKRHEDPKRNKDGVIKSSIKSLNQTIRSISDYKSGRDSGVNGTLATQAPLYGGLSGGGAATTNNDINYWGVKGVNFPSVEAVNTAGCEGVESQPPQMYPQSAYPNPSDIVQPTAGHRQENPIGSALCPVNNNNNNVDSVHSDPSSHPTTNRNIVSSDTDMDLLTGDYVDLTDDRLQSNRERNREHAKNTRLRKKAYVERLKITVDELCKERDTIVNERANSAQLMVETHSKRVDVLRSFFALRASYSRNQKRELWSSILDESCFTCRLPVTPYQSFPSSEVQLSNCQRTISGVDAMIADVASNDVFLETLVDRHRYPEDKIKFQYTLATEESVVAGNQIMARWAMETLNAKKCGARTELHQQGMLFCKFNSAHKIVSLEIMFDVMAFMLQVKMAMGFDNFNEVVIPNTMQTCQKQYDYPMVMTLADRPHTIVQVNERWENLTGYKGADVVGKFSCKILQGSETSRKELDLFMSPVLFKRPSCGMLTNYTKSGRRYRSYVTIYPLSTDSNISHYFGLTTFVQWIDADKPQGNQGKDCSGVNGGNNTLTSKQSRHAHNGLSSTSKHVKINERSFPSYCNDTGDNPVKIVSASIQDKQSLSSFTGSGSGSGSSDGREAEADQTRRTPPQER